MATPIPRNALVTEDGNIVLPGQFDPTKTRARPITPREYFASTGRINAKPQNPRYMGGGKFDILQNRDVSAFQDPRRPGMSVDEIAEDASRRGYTVGPGGVLRRDGLQPSAAAPTREQNIAAAKAAGTFEGLRQKYNRENSDKVMDEAGNINREQNIAAAKAAGTFEEIRRRYNQENPDKVMDEAGNIKAADKTKAGGVAAPKPDVQATPGLFSATAKTTQGAPATTPAATAATAATAAPPAAAAPTREQKVAAAKAAGTFEEIRRKYNRENLGKRMNERGDIVEVKEEPAAKPDTRPPPPDDRPSVASANARQRFFGNLPKRDGTLASAAGVNPDALRPSFDPLPTAPAATITPQPAVETPAMRRQMMRDAAMDRSETRDSSGRLTGIQSRYGAGSVKFLKPGEARPEATTTDEFDKPETMKSYLARRKAIQQSKGMS